MASDPEFEVWKQEKEKDRIIDLISMKGTLDISQVSDILNKPIDEIKPLLTQLENAKLIKSDIGNYYHLTFEGQELLRCRKERSRIQQR